MSEPINLDVEYKALIKEKILDAYEQNPLILEQILKLRSKANITREHRFVNSSFLAGIIVSLCSPEITNLLLLMLELTSDIDAVFQAIGINVDPRPELEQRAEARRLQQEASLIDNTKISGLLTEDPDYLAAHEELERIRDYSRQQENSA